MTDVQKIKAHLASGYGFVNYLQSVKVNGEITHVGSSADRTCRKICNGDKNYSYFMVEPSYGNISPYKCFIRIFVYIKNKFYLYICVRI